MSDIYDWAQSLARPVIAGFAAYSARGASTQALHLDANESPWSPPPAGPSVKDYNRYPAQQPAGLMARLAGLYEVDQSQIMLGRGADEAIDVLLRTFCEPGQDRILICPPTFGYFSVAAQIQGADIVSVPLQDDFSWDEPSIHKALQDNDVKMVMLCSPNNPTGNSVDREFVLRLCNDNPNTLVVVDEAYIEFSSEESFSNEINSYKNLIVTRTLSKAYGLAGVRAGVAIARAEIILSLIHI